MKANDSDSRKGAMVVKRPKGFDEADDDVRETSKKFKSMRIDEEIEQ